MRWMLIASLVTLNGCAFIRSATNTPPPYMTAEQQRAKAEREDAINAQQRAGFSRAVVEATKTDPTMRCTPDPYRAGVLNCVQQ